MLISTQAFAITGLSSMDRENGLLSDEAIEWINTHKPDEVSGKINHHYWWKIKGYYVAIHKHNIRKHANSADTAEAFIISKLEDIIYAEEVKKHNERRAIASKIVILRKLGLSDAEIGVFLAPDYPVEIIFEYISTGDSNETN